MECVMFVPGIMGSVLKTPAGDEIWPPTVWETQFGYGRKDQLLRDDLVAPDIVRTVWCAGIYQPLVEQLSDIGYSEDAHSGKRLVVFPYDWRRDLEQTAELLSRRLADLVTSGATRITIVAHSMGGLIARLALESHRFETEAWFQRVTAFLALATPHLGAPQALARILGLDSALGISAADFKELAADRRYPSGYQLLPPPAEAICWDLATDDLRPIEIYSAAAASRLGLDPVLLARARFVQETLAGGAQPPHVRYFYFAGTGHATPTRINVGSSGQQVTSATDAGDGTVPMWSALPRSGQKQLVFGEHASFFNGVTFKAVFYRLLGARYPVPPLGAAPEIAMSVQSISIRQNDPIDLLLSPSTPVGQIKGEVRLWRTEDPGQSFTQFREPARVSYDGPQLPHLKLVLPAPGKSGLYRIDFVGQPVASSPVVFAATAK